MMNISSWPTVGSPQPPNTAMRLLQRGGTCPADSRLSEVNVKQSDGSSGGRSLVCIACGNLITHSSHQIQVNGGHRHRFTNPAGVTFDVACFSEAPGCSNREEPTSAHTWFAGYQWRFSMCSKCGIHLGWFYQRSDGGSFFGLNSRHLLERDSNSEKDACH